MARDPYKPVRSEEKEQEVILLREELLKMSESIVEDDNEVIGYSILFTGNDGHKLKSTYPTPANSIILGMHTGLLTDEEFGILTVMEDAINKRIKKGQGDVENGSGTDISKAKEE
jgi:hypothetical protein